jgi:S-adenosylmethionine/arginine decarboxylase-like enzyme
MLRVAGLVNGWQRRILRDQEFLRTYIPVLVSAIGMHPVGPVIIQPYAHWMGGAPSAVQFLEESAAWIHCYPEDDLIQVVLDSCLEIRNPGKVALDISVTLNLHPHVIHYDKNWGWKALLRDLSSAKRQSAIEE